VKRSLTPRTLGIVVAVAVLAYAAGGYFLLVGPKKAEASSLDKEIAAATVELAAARAVAAPQDDTQPIAVADIFRLSTAMPSTPDMPGILLELSRLAEETGIRFKSVSPQTGEVSGGYYAVPVDITLDGSFYELSDFLFRLRTLVTVRRGELHASGRLFSIDSVDFAEAEAGFPTLTAGLRVNAYVYGTDVAETAAPPAAEEPPTTTEGAEVPPPAGSEAAPEGS
jgi:Tfp pilus assembly protein PilO